MCRIWYAIDPGLSGGMSKWKDRDLIKTFEFNREVYKNEFESNKHLEPFIVLEYIPTVIGGSFASYKLGQEIGFIRGLAFANNIPIIEKDNMPKQWKAPWKERLIKPKNVKWPNGESKRRSIELVKKLYPNAVISKIEHKKTKDKEIMLDGICDAILIGRSFIERKLLEKYL